MITRIFISHSVTDAELVAKLKSFVERKFIGAIKCFVSSDRSSIPPGTPWFDEIRNGIQESSLAIVVCSPTSVTRPWVNFEAGAAYFSGLRVIPLLVRGLDRSQLPAPLSLSQVLDASDKADLYALINSIAEAASLRVPSGAPSIRYTVSFNNSLVSFPRHMRGRWI